MHLAKTFLLAILMVMTCNTVKGQQSYRFCNTVFWKCNGQEKDRVAFLDGETLEKQLPLAFGSTRSLEADFSNDEGVKRLNIHTNAEVEIKSVIGPEMEVISVQGNKKIIKDLCIFSQQSLPKLKEVLIKNAGIEFFGYQQFQNCLVLRNLLMPSFRLSIRHSVIEMDPTKSPDSKLTFHDSPLLSKLTLANVSFAGLKADQVVISDQLKDKFEGQFLFFEDNLCGCNYRKDQGTWDCIQGPCSNLRDVRLPFQEEEIFNTTEVPTSRSAFIAALPFHKMFTLVCLLLKVHADR